jgi:phage terminase large subunit GpA-like protein
MWEPPEELAISAWAEKYRVLRPPAEEQGPLRLQRTPYLRPLMDAFDDPTIETVVFCKSAQIAGTEAMLSVIGKYAHDGGNPIMLVLADEDTAIYISEKRVQTMFRSSEALAALIIEERMNQKEITLANESYICLAWASSVAKLASRPIRIVIFDEVDKPGYYITTKEADAISLGIERTESFFNRKIGILSTPTVEEGNIWRELSSCDIIYDWHVPCPACGQFQPLRWSLKYCSEFEEGAYRGVDDKRHPLGQVIWEGGQDATPEQIEAAGYQCGTCQALWTTIEKNRAVENGQPVARMTPSLHPRKVGYHINRLYSLLGKSGDIPKLVADWIIAVKSGDLRKLQGFINSTLAEPWRHVVSTSSESAILKAKVDTLLPQTVPQQAVCLTAGVDVQKYGFWFVIRAWAADYTNWLVHYGQLATWDDVEELLFNTLYPIAGNGDKHAGEEPKGKRIWRAAIDTGGGEGFEEGLSMTEETEIWIREHLLAGGCRIWGTKGASRPLAGMLSLGIARDKTPSGKPLPGGLQIISLNTDKLKDMFHYRLQQAIEGNPGGAYLHAATEKTYVAHILAEEKRVDRKTGAETWVRIKRRNDLLDCECMAAACVDPEWPGGGLNLLSIGRRTFTGIHPGDGPPMRGRSKRRVISKGIR